MERVKEAVEWIPFLCLSDIHIAFRLLRIHEKIFLRYALTATVAVLRQSANLAR